MRECQDVRIVVFIKLARIVYLSQRDKCLPVRPLWQKQASKNMMACTRHIAANAASFGMHYAHNDGWFCRCHITLK